MKSPRRNIMEGNSKKVSRLRYVQCTAVWYKVLQYSVQQCGISTTVQCTAVWYKVLQYSVQQCGIKYYSTVYSSVV